MKIIISSSLYSIFDGWTEVLETNYFVFLFLDVFILERITDIMIILNK